MPFGKVLISKFLSIAYAGCFSTAGMSGSISPTYSSLNFMTIGFCVQICQGVDSTFANTAFVALQVTLSTMSYSSISASRVLATFK